jgi:hypothetical protein
MSLGITAALNSLSDTERCGFDFEVWDRRVEECLAGFNADFQCCGGYVLEPLGLECLL